MSGDPETVSKGRGQAEIFPSPHLSHPQGKQGLPHSWLTEFVPTPFEHQHGAPLVGEQSRATLLTSADSHLCLG